MLTLQRYLNSSNLDINSFHALNYLKIIKGVAAQALQLSRNRSSGECSAGSVAEIICCKTKS